MLLEMSSCCQGLLLLELVTGGGRAETPPGISRPKLPLSPSYAQTDAGFNLGAHSQGEVQQLETD